MSKKNVKYPEIKKSICEREHLSRTDLRAAIRNSSGEERWTAWAEKRRYGHDTRHLLLAYGMLRGLPYVVCEPKCDEFNAPSVTGIQTAAKLHGHTLEIDTIRAWLSAQQAGTEAVKETPAAPIPSPALETPVVIPAAVPGKPGIFARMFGKSA